MRRDVIQYIQTKKELLQYLREQPNWYRQLARNPNQLQSFEIAAMNYFEKTIPHQVEKFSTGVQMASLMMSMFQSMNSQAQSSELTE